MADNYLESKYEQYQARKAMMGKAGSAGRRPAPKGKPRRVFVTGGAGGIGRAIVEAFCADGHKVAFCDIDDRQGAATAQKSGAVFHHLDVADTPALEACVQQLIDEWGDLDVIVNNAGYGGFAPLTETTVDAFDRLLAVNLRPAFVTARLLARHRSSRPECNPYGRIINLCSTRYLMSEPGSEGYAASKGGLYSLTHALALSLAEWGVTVNSIAPGWIETGDYRQLRPEDHRQHPSGRVGKPEDIARLCLFLCHEENNFINGENITIDGGMTKKMIYIE